MSTFQELPVISAGTHTHLPNQSDPILGIDLGTTNSLIAIVEAGVPRVLNSSEGKKLIPSVVFFDSKGNAQVGYRAREQRGVDPLHTIYSVKRLLGRGAADVTEILPQLHYLVQGNETGLRVQVGQKEYSPVEISALILKELKKSAELALGRSVEDTVITVPAYFNDAQRQATRIAGRLAGFNVLRILNEPTAAALAYGIHQKKNGVIAVYDFGGGTFDISILKLRDGIFEVLSTNGDTMLGGDDLDQLIVEKILSQHPKALEKSPALTGFAEELKIALSKEKSIKRKIPGTELELHLTQDDLKALALPLLEKTKTPVLRALKDASVVVDQITDVVLVGGPTRLPFLKEFVRDLFNREPNSNLNPDEVVALGAAVQADILAGGSQDLLLLDVVPLSLGIETFGGAMNVLIPRNSKIPILAKEQFTTYTEGQTKIAINVFQGERGLVQENRKLGEFVLSGVPPLPAGVARIEVTFLVDADGILSVSAKEIYSGVEQSIEVRPTFGLTDAQVEEMLLQGLENTTKDQSEIKLIEARNDAQTILTATEKSLTQAGHLLEPQEREHIQKIASELKTVFLGSAIHDIQRLHRELNQATLKLAEALMHQTVSKDLKNKSVTKILPPSGE